MIDIDTELQWFAEAVRYPWYSASARLILYPDGVVWTGVSLRRDAPDAYHVFRPEDFR